MSEKSALEMLREVEPQKRWTNSAGPWVLVHVPTGSFVATPRTLPSGQSYSGYAFKRKRDAVAALNAFIADVTDAEA